MSNSVNPYAAPATPLEHREFVPLKHYRLVALSHALKTLNSLTILVTISVTVVWVMQLFSESNWIFLLIPGMIAVMLFSTLLQAINAVFRGVLGHVISFGCILPLTWPVAWVAVNWRGRRLLTRQGYEIGVLGGIKRNPSTNL